MSDIEAEFLARVGRVAWCNMAIVIIIAGRVRASSVRSGKETWGGSRREFISRICTWRPVRNVSLAYVAGAARQVYVDGLTIAANSLANKERVWAQITSSPEPVGYDPLPFVIALDDPELFVLKLEPRRIELVTESPPASLVWHADPAKFA